MLNGDQFGHSAVLLLSTLYPHRTPNWKKAVFRDSSEVMCHQPSSFEGKGTIKIKHTKRQHSNSVFQQGQGTALLQKPLRLLPKPRHRHQRRTPSPATPICSNTNDSAQPAILFGGVVGGVAVVIIIALVIVIVVIWKRRCK